MAAPNLPIVTSSPVDAVGGGPPSVASRRTARRVFSGALAYTSLMTALWLFFVITQRDGGAWIGRYNVDRETIPRVLFGFVFFTVVWGWIWYRIRRWLLRRVTGFSKEELALVFTSRMNQPFAVSAFLASHSERTIRIIDMVGRRGRFITVGLAGFLYIHNRILENPDPQLLTLGFQDNLFDAVFFCWLNLAAYYSDGFFGRVAYGAQSRLMDGTRARANCLLIGTLWHAFKFVMVPIGIQLTAHFPPPTYAALFGFIWLSYQVSDTLSEVVGSLLGRQKLRVWGIGDVNRKSVAGTWACFLGSLGLCVWMVSLHGLPWPWLGLALAVSVSNTFFELLSPRGTDDFTMATANALLCWAFGALVY